MAHNKPNPVTDITMRTLQNLKVIVPPLLQDFIKAAEKYQKSATATSQLGVQLADTIFRIGTSSQSDLGEGIKKLAEFIKDTEARRDEVARAMLSDLIVPLRASIENDQRESVNFEKNYKRDKDNMRSEIMKLENRTKKAGKKTTPEVLKQQISELNDKIKEAETMRSTKLRDIILLERKRYASFLAMWNQLLSKEHDTYASAVNKMKGGESMWVSLAGSAGQVPKEYDDMISKQERTFVQIQPVADDGTGSYRLSYAPGAMSAQSYSSSYDQNYDSYDSYSSYDDTPSSSYDYNSGGGAAGGAQARALYNYESAEPSDLPLVANDIVMILQDDDGSGWTKGQDSSGRVGIFPTSYIEYI